MTNTTQINQYGQQVGFALPAWQPVAKPACVALPGQYCQLAPLDSNHCDALFQAFSLAEDDRDWTWLGANKPQTREKMAAWIAHKIADDSLVPYAVINCTDNRACGVVCWSAIDTVNGAIEIGHVTWSPLMQRNVMGTEALYLLLSQAFALGYRRVAWRCDSTNIASRRAAERIGFTFEGCFRQVMTRKQRNRDTDWLSIIDSEWPPLRAALEAWLNRENFDSKGKQKRALESFIQRPEQWNTAPD